MKKNRMMRLASFMLVAVLLTTCSISGTYAKYVTSASGSDTARVAKWGVTVTGMESDLFKTGYDGTVTSSASDKVVAPGTKNDTGVTFSLTGKPEVSVNVQFAVTGSDGTSPITDVVLPKKDGYKDFTQAPYTGTFNISDANGYHPVVFTLKDGSNTLVTGTLAEVETYLEAKSATYGPNTDLNELFGVGGTGNYTLTWAWAIDGNDKADTYLGNVAAGTHTDATAITELDFAITITVTQVD